MSPAATGLVRTKTENKVKIGIIGTGLMGQPMGLRLLEKGEAVVAYNRTPSKLFPLEQAGATIADSPVEVFANAEVTILMLSDAKAIASILESVRELQGKTIIQMGTIAPTESQSIQQQVSAVGGSYLEAPVLGSIPQVKTGELIVMVGSTSQQFQQWQPLLQHYSPEPLHVGEVGKASAMKLALNQLIAGLTATFALSLGFVRQQGVNVEQFMDVVRTSALYAPTFDKKLSRMQEANFDNPNFPTKHLLKDTQLFLSQAESLGLATDGLRGIETLIEKAIALGLAERDYSAIYQATVSKEATD